MKKMSQHDVENGLIAITSQLLSESGEPHKKNIYINDSLQQLGIDSLGRAELFKRIESAFQVSIPDKLLAEAETLQDIATYLQEAHPQIVTSMPKQFISHTQRTNVNVDDAKTLIDVLLKFGEEAADKTHIYFYNENGQEEEITYGRLLESSLKVAQGLRELGLREGETVAIMQPTSPNFFYIFLGTLLAGGIPVPIYPPFRMHMLETYAKQESRILLNAQVRILVTFNEAEKLSLLLKAFVPSLKHVTSVEELLQSKKLPAVFKAKSDSFAMIQYTSGSTSDPKGVLLTHFNLLSNVRGYGKTIKITPDDVAISWLPLYHDLGLIGMWLGSLYHGVPLVLLTPFTFLNRPERWLWAIHYHRGTISGAPNFAYELCIRKIEPQQLEGLDLSSLRIAANGAEKVYPRTLDEFAKKFARFGFKRNALLPVYGLAESTVGLLIPPLGREFRLDTINREKFEAEQIAEPSQDKNALSFVSCGMPIAGHEIKIVDEKGDTLAERHVGSLYFRGPSNMQGYFNNPRATDAVYHDGWIDSGDLAYIAEGEAFITGRRKDLIIKAGRNIYPAEIEEFVGQVPGVRQGCTVAFGDIDAERGTEQLIIVTETRENNRAARDKIIENIKKIIAENLDVVPDHVILVAPHVVPKTSSGKLQRAPCKKMYLEGRLGKTKAPAWVQISRLGLQWFARKVADISMLILKSIYTLYVALLICLTILPIYILVRFTSRQVAVQTCRVWARFILALSFCPINLTGKEHLKRRPLIYAANHGSYLDSVVLLSVLPPETRFIGKKELFSMPFLKTFLKKLDYLPVDRLDFAKGLEDTKRIESTLKAGNSIMIFPEGTFGYAEGLRPFRLGAFKLATETGISICPIGLQGVRYILRDDEKILSPGRVKVSICEPILPKGAEWQDVTQLRGVVRSEIAKCCGEAPLDYIVAEKVLRSGPPEG